MDVCVGVRLVSAGVGVGRLGNIVWGVRREEMCRRGLFLGVPVAWERVGAGYEEENVCVWAGRHRAGHRAGW